VVLAGSILGMREEPLAIALAWGALAGAGVQLLLLLPSAKKLLGELRPRLDLADGNVRQAGARLPGALLGRGIIQISGLVDTLLVSFLGTGANAAFSYAQTIYLLPMSLLGTGEAAAVLPELSRDSAEADLERRNAALRERLGSSMARLTALTVPIMAAFALLGREIITVLLQTGSFDRSATDRVVPLLAAYGFALLGNASGRVLTTMAYALGDTRTPALYSAARVIVSTVIALALMRPLGVVGVVLGAVIAAWVETFALGARLGRTLGGIGLGQVRWARIGLLAALSAGAGMALRAVLPMQFASSFWGASMILGAFGAAFAVAAPLLGLFDVRSLLRRRR
jgi:putative peptidoglycan lipid II flippase